MYRALLTAALVAAYLSVLSCLPGNCVSGEGNTVKRTLELPSVHSITIQGSLDVELTQGNEQAVEVEGQANLLDMLETDVKDGHWTIRTKECYRTDKPFVVRLSVPAIDHVAVQGSGDVKGTGTFTANAIELEVQGSGDIELNIQAGTVKADVQGSGTVKLAGACEDLQATVQGSGDVKASGLAASKVTAEVMGSGDVEVRTDGDLNGQVMGSGDIRYWGKPTSVNVKVTGSGTASPGKTN